MNIKKTVAVYFRVSTLDQKTDSQQREVLDYARRRWPKIKPTVYEDKISGAKVTRPALDRMMHAIRAGTITAVVCWKLDRLGRSLSHLAMILEELTRLKVPLVCTSQGIDTSDDNPAGRLQIGVLSAVAQFEREIIRERVMAGQSAAKARGVKFGRPNRAMQHRADIMKMRKQGKSIRAIAIKFKISPATVHKLASA